MASALINVPAKAKRGEIIEIKTLMSHIMETGYRHTAQAKSSRAISSRASSAASTATRSSAPICSRRSQPIPSSRSSRPRPKAASSNSNGSATRDFPKPLRLPSPSNEVCRYNSGAADRGGRRAAEIPASPAPVRYSFMAPDTRRCRATTPPIPACSGCSTAKSCGRKRPAAPTRPAPIATAMPAPA